MVTIRNLTVDYVATQLRSELFDGNNKTRIRDGDESQT